MAYNERSKNSALLFKDRKNAYPAMQASPHIREKSSSTRKIMLDVLIALCPAVLFSIYLFGWRVALLYALSIATALICEAIICLIRKKTFRMDLSAVVTGTLLVMSFPANAPLWFAPLGAFCGIVIAKELFGGIGKNFLNPALVGRAVLRICFEKTMVQNPWPAPPFAYQMPEVVSGATVLLDGVSAATPLKMIKEGMPLGGERLWDAFTGMIGGKLGETSALLLLIGAIYLIARGVIRLRIPLSMLGTMALLAFVFGGQEGLFSADYSIVLGHLIGGGTILVAFFMATDYSSSPSGKWAQIIYGIGCGALTMAFRLLGEYPEGITFAMLIMNFSVPLFNYFMIPRALGVKKKALFKQSRE